MGSWVWTCVGLALAHVVCVKSTGSKTFDIVENDDGFSVFSRTKEVIRHSHKEPCLYVGRGSTSFSQEHGNWEIDDSVSKRIGLPTFRIAQDTSQHDAVGFKERVYKINITLSSPDGIMVKLSLQAHSLNRILLQFEEYPVDYDRLWFRLHATKDESVYGGGEQYSSFNLRGKSYPMWIREQGVGRNPDHPITNIANNLGKGAGGAYHTTYYPQPTFVTSRIIYYHVNGYNYFVLDFTNPNFHEVMILGKPSSIVINEDDNMLVLQGKLSYYLYRQSLVPSWVHEGAILGVQGGTETMLKRLKYAQDNGVQVKGIWIQDWSGKIVTKFGKRVFWNWEWDPNHYPGLDKEIKRLREQGIRVLAYITPHLHVDGNMYKSNKHHDYFVKNSTGDHYLIDFMEFDCVTVDLTNPEALSWYKGIIKTNLLDFGFRGWMADFSEYVPVDGVYHSGISGPEAHNNFAVLWAKTNFDACELTFNILVDDILYFMRAGFSGASRYTPLTWAGDQNVDFSYSDGLPTVIPAALSLGVSGVQFTHFDIGLYTTILREGMVDGKAIKANMTRSEELLLRSAEMAVFTPVMRTHEGNLPDANVQVYSNDSIIRKFAVLTQMFAALSPYTKDIALKASRGGIPMQRPLFLHYDQDPESYNVHYQYLYGEDLLVAPVVDSGASTWMVYLPPDHWKSIYNDETYVGPKRIRVDAPIGQPPVFYKEGSKWSNVFKTVGQIALGKGQCDADGICS